jgi:hypothetical protein
MKERAAAAFFLLAAMGATGNAQSSAPNQLRTPYFLCTGAIGWLSEGGPICEDSRMLGVPKVGLGAAPGKFVLGVGWGIFLPDGRKQLNLSPTFAAHIAMPTSFALASGPKTALASAVFHSETPQSTAYVPLTGGDRARWTLKSSFGWRGLGSGVSLSALETATNLPREWHGTWEGFGKRFGTRQAGVTLSNTLEASLGAAWGEDPRYSRSGRQGIWPRAGCALKMAILAQHRNGTRKPAYARFVGAIGSNFITNTWRPPSDNDWEHALARSGLGLVARLASNLVTEFWR